VLYQYSTLIIRQSGATWIQLVPSQ